MMTEKELFDVRIALIRAFLQERGIGGVLLSRPDNFAMATGGKRNYIWTATDLGANSLFVTREGEVFFVGNNIETARVMEEELAPFGCGVKDFLWFEGDAGATVEAAFPGDLASDTGAVGVDVHEELAVLRALLTETELEKYRRLGALAAEAMTATLGAITHGATEADVAARLIAEGEQRRCRVPVALVAADDRIAKYRHPLPTQALLLNGRLQERQVERYVMVVGCFLREGLVVSLTRLKRVAPLPQETEDAYRRICAVDCRFQQAARPGRTLGEVFDDGARAYREFGFAATEWHNHHQGGATGYAGRTCKGHPGVSFPVLDTHWPRKAAALLGREIPFGSAFAWNPSAPGVKSEDTFILRPDGGTEIVSQTPALPSVDLGSLLDEPFIMRKSGIA